MDALERDVPVQLSDIEKIEYEVACESHWETVKQLRQHRDQAYYLILGQCTQRLQTGMTMDPSWEAVRRSTDPLELYELIKKVILKQQHPVASHVEQMKAFFTIKQGNLSIDQYYNRFKRMYEITKLAEVEFKHKIFCDYVAERKLNESKFDLLTQAQQKEVEELAKDKFLAYLCIDGSRHDALKTKLHIEYVCFGLDLYPKDLHQAYRLLVNVSHDVV